MSNFKVLINSFCLLITLSAIGQKTDYSGKWLLKIQESISGSLYENGVSKKMVVTQNNNNINIEKTTLGQDNNDIVTKETLFFDGKSFEAITASKRKKVITMKWDEDKKNLNVIAVLKNAIDNSKEDMKISDTWTLNSDGKLVFVRKSENYLNGEVWESRSIYEKE